jgi:hypothetical protein
MPTAKRTTAPQSALKKPEEATAKKSSPAEIARAALFAQLGREVRFLGEKVDGIIDFAPRGFDMVRGKMGILEDENKYTRTELFKTKAEMEEMEERNEKFMKRYEKMEQKHEKLEPKEKKMSIPFVTKTNLVLDSYDTRLNTMSFHKRPSCCSAYPVPDRQLGQVVLTNTDTNNAAGSIDDFALRLNLSSEPTDYKVTPPRLWSSASAIGPMNYTTSLKHSTYIRRRWSRRTRLGSWKE